MKGIADISLWICILCLLFVPFHIICCKLGINRYSDEKRQPGDHEYYTSDGYFIDTGDSGDCGCDSDCDCDCGCDD